MYGKIFASMYDGTLATRGPWQALVTFQQMIVLAEFDGTVDMTPEALSRRTTIPLDIITIGLAALEAPDDQSRSDNENGRRIVRLDPDRPWGWRIVNHAHYRAIRTAEERREYMRQYQRQRRSKHVNRLSTDVNNVTHADADADADADAEVSLPSGESVACATPGAKVNGKKPKRHGLGHFVPDGWEIPDEDASWALAEFPSLDLFAATQKFRDHEFAQPRSDWRKTWRNWVRQEAEMQARRAGSGRR